MIKIRIVSVGKTKEAWLEQALAEYLQRLKAQVIFEFCWCKDDVALTALVERANSEKVIGLDPNGQLMTSERFAEFFDRQVVEGGSKVTFVIGGADGLPSVLKTNLNLISLSPLTFTHQITRLILIEQIYRAIEILKGSKYHKGSQ
ncbi:MAG: 23S rRNA (pseudouridine(1915)-N(3))-methyltransferase RlmH [Parachlamydiaceae bacterium]|nr:23S rRNA (pseudouridine(1915)-N(3))-methyltransferase RlmH [Parachlamydiaceae bacterium]